jgi:hypothetical protein
MSKYADVAVIEDSGPEALFKRGATDFQFFAGLCIPQVFRFPFPPLYIAIWTLLVSAQSREDREAVLRFALGLPRGFAKTTFLKILVCWLIVYDKVSFALIVGATESLAQNFISDVNSILGSANIEKIYGAWTMNLAIDNREQKKAAYRRRVIILMGIGAGTAIRGINIAYERPDLILCDDAQTKECADSDTEAEHFLDWLTGTLFNVIDPFFAMIIYSGNMYPNRNNCILAKFEDHPDWVSLITGCILADGKSLWEEVRPLRNLWRQFKHDEALGRAHIWFAEYMNQSWLDKISLLPNELPIVPMLPEECVPDCGVCIIDPAGLKRTSDDNVLAFTYFIDNIGCVVKLVVGQSDPEHPIRTPKEVIKVAIQQCLILGIRVIVIEDVAYQSTLQFWFEEILKEQGLEDHFRFLPINPGSANKEKRIIASTKNLYDGSWFFLRDDDRVRYVFQGMSYKIGKPKQKDDILDTCAYIEELRKPENWNFIHQFPMSAPETETGVLINDDAFV